jgi:hypothetical protein
MMTRAIRRGFVLLAAVAAAVQATACDDNTTESRLDPLTDASKAALDEATQDAYRTYYTYSTVSMDLDAAAPFDALKTAELTNTNQLRALYQNRGLTSPASEWSATNVPRYQNLHQACQAAEESEVATEMMFERLLRLNLPADVRQAFQTIRTTARSQHRLQFRNCAGDAITPATAEVQAAMAEALQDEYHAYYTYGRVLADLGDVAPFHAIQEAEWMHIGAAANLFVKRDLTPPASTWTLDNVPVFTSIPAACAGGVTAEQENIAMYDRLLQLELPVDVERVFQTLRAASLEHHLPAFENCAP